MSHFAIFGFNSAGFRSFWIVLAGFGSFWLVPSFSKYDILSAIAPKVTNGSFVFFQPGRRYNLMKMSEYGQFNKV